jgi:hypothetical protein
MFPFFFSSAADSPFPPWSFVSFSGGVAFKSVILCCWSSSGAIPLEPPSTAAAETAAAAAPGVAWRAAV